jgi:hypothetical protein
MQSTQAAKIYGIILSKPGITAREINKELGTAAIGGTLNSFVKRGAIIGVPGEKERSTKYYKGRAPIALRQPKGQTQAAIEREFDAVAMRNELVKSKALLESMIKQLDRAIA